MGALFGGNADRQWGYKIGDKIVPPSIDRIDGGGPGRSGPRFEGGGLLSDIGNALMRPYGYRDRQAAMQAVRPNMPTQGLLTPAPAPAPAPAPTPTYRGPAAGVATVDYPPIQSAASRYLRDEDQVMGMPFVPPMPQAYFDRLVQLGVNPDAITPVGRPMTMDEFSSMSKYMSGPPTGVWPSNVTKQDETPVTAAPALRRAAGTPAASLSAVEQDPYFQYLVDAGVSDRAAQYLADDTSWGGMRLRKAFETTGAIPVMSLSVLLKRHGR